MTFKLPHLSLDEVSLGEVRARTCVRVLARVCVRACVVSSILVYSARAEKV